MSTSKCSFSLHGSELGGTIVMTPSRLLTQLTSFQLVRRARNSGVKSQLGPRYRLLHPSDGLLGSLPHLLMGITGNMRLLKFGLTTLINGFSLIRTITSSMSRVVLLCRPMNSVTKHLQ